MIVVIDYGMGNVGAIINMLKKVGKKAVLSDNPEIISNAEKLILPGVGAFDNGMANLKARGLIQLLNWKVMEEKTPILGICLGAQLFTHYSEEGQLNGLGWLDAETVRFQLSTEMRLRVPHMGWNTIKPEKECELLNQIDALSRFYFVHSFYMKSNNHRDVLTTTHYGFDFASALQKENIIGVQFHPEKSHKFGIQLMRNFVERFNYAKNTCDSMPAA